MTLKTHTCPGNKIARIPLSLLSDGSKETTLNGVIDYRTARVYRTLRRLLYISQSHLLPVQISLLSHRLLDPLLTQSLLTHPLLIQQMRQFQLTFGIILSSSKQLCSKRRWRRAIAAMNIGFR